MHGARRCRARALLRPNPARRQQLDLPLHAAISHEAETRVSLGGVAQPGRALRSQRRSRGFKSHHLHNSRNLASPSRSSRFVSAATSTAVALLRRARSASRWHSLRVCATKPAIWDTAGPLFGDARYGTSHARSVRPVLSQCDARAICVASWLSQRGNRWHSLLMIATVDIADLGVRRTLLSLRHRPAPTKIPGLRWLDTAAAVPLASKHPPGFRRSVMIAFWDDEDAAATFMREHPLGKRFAENGFHAVLRPIRAYGAWPGLPDEVPRRARDQSRRSRSRHDAWEVAHEPGRPVPPSKPSRRAFSARGRRFRVGYCSDTSCRNTSAVHGHNLAVEYRGRRGCLRVRRPRRRPPACCHQATAQGLPSRVSLHPPRPTRDDGLGSRHARDSPIRRPASR